MEDSKVLDVIEKECIVKEDKKYLTCTKATEIAKDLKIDIKMIGDLCNKNKIKITTCQLGCF